jgi:hypothetical protein
MLKISKEEFIEELQAELYGYEEIDEDTINDFVKRVQAYFEAGKGKNVDYKNGVTIKMNDEGDLFMIADRFLSAVVNEELDKYWQNWEI